jgi:dihydroceramidase
MHQQFIMKPSFHPNPRWGNATSTLDFCEANYQVTAWIAEFFNATTNALFLGLSLFGIHWVRKLNVESRFTISFILLGVVGIGSFLFHSTLHWHTQLLDELPMIWGLSVFIFATLHMAPPPVTRLKTPWSWSLPLPKDPQRTARILVIYSVVFTIVYVLIRNPVFHEVNFGAQVALVTLLGALFCYRLRFTSNGPTLSRYFVIGAVSFLFGFLLWNIDNLACDSHLIPMREKFGQFGFLLEMHAWWHIFTGMGTYTISTCCVFMRLLVTHRKNVVLNRFGPILYVSSAPDHKQHPLKELIRTTSESNLPLLRFRRLQTVMLKTVKSVSQF